MANREDEKEAIPFLEEAESMYKDVINACNNEDKQSIFDKLTLKPLDIFLLTSKNEFENEGQVEPVIMRGFEMNLIEASYTQSLFYLA